MIVDIPEKIKRKMKGSRRYKKETRDSKAKNTRMFGYSQAKKPNWWTKIKKFIKNVIGRK